MIATQILRATDLYVTGSKLDPEPLLLSERCGEAGVAGLAQEHGGVVGLGHGEGVVVDGLVLVLGLVGGVDLLAVPGPVEGRQGVAAERLALQGH